MAQAAKKADVLEFPAGGIADFYMEDDEIEALEREEAKEQFGNNGIANFSDVATRMASYGRYGDDTVAHVETGELVIPKALIDENPKLRDSIFQHLEELGVEDPERYVVGSGANSINPDTGLPEFFLNKIFRGVKKAASKIARGVKKVTKSVVKVVKKAAPLIIPIALNVLFPGMGAIYQGALGAGIGTLVQGGNLKDAFKSALIGGALGGAMEGVKGGYKAAKAGGDFNAVSKGAFDGIKGAARLSNLSEAGQQLMTGQFGESGLDAVRKSALDVASVPPSEMLDASTAVGQPDSVREAFAQSGARARPAAFTPDAGASDASSFTDFMGGPPAGSNLSTEVATAAYKPRSFLENIQAGEFKEAFLPSGPTPEQVLLQKQQAYSDALATYGVTPATASTAQQTAAAAEAAKVTAASMGPGALATFGPSAALGVGALALGGGFSAEDDPPPAEAPPIKQGPEYMVGGLDPQGSTGPTVVGTNYGIDPRTGRPYVNPFRRPVYGRPATVGHLAQLAAEGGEIFPRRVGGIMPNEGTPGKDSVRAMLMPGEFVMTTDAVKGLGNGNNDQGINRMYDMMRGLEAKGRAMA
jgi:hypothetical protein